MDRRWWLDRIWLRETACWSHSVQGTTRPRDQTWRQLRISRRRSTSDQRYLFLSAPRHGVRFIPFFSRVQFILMISVASLLFNCCYYSIRLHWWIHGGLVARVLEFGPPFTKENNFFKKSCANEKQWHCFASKIVHFPSKEVWRLRLAENL